MSEVKTGTDAIRAQLRIFMAKGHLATVAHDIDGAGVAVLESFATGGAQLPLPVMQQLAKLLLDAKLDPATGLLQPLQRPESRPLCASGIPRFEPKDAPFFQPLQASASRPGPSPVKPVAKAKPVTWPARRAGWSE